MVGQKNKIGASISTDIKSPSFFAEKELNRIKDEIFFLVSEKGCDIKNNCSKNNKLKNRNVKEDYIKDCASVVLRSSRVSSS